MRALFYDTETTGLPLFKEPSDDPRQPHLVQIIACLFDMDRYSEISSLDAIVAPDGWVIPDDVVAVHGISAERATRWGIPETEAIARFLSLWQASDVRIAYNESFDARIIRIALKRYGLLALDEWKAGKAECAARLATPIVALPPTPKMRAAKRFHHKMPNLAEAFRFFTGREMQGAHNAKADVDALMTVYFAAKAHIKTGDQSQ